MPIKSRTRSALGQLVGWGTEVGPGLDHRLVPGEAAIVHEGGDEQGRHRLGRRADTKERVGCDGRAAGQVTDAEGVAVDGALSVDDSDGGADHAEGLHGGLHGGVELLPVECRRGTSCLGAGNGCRSSEALAGCDEPGRGHALDQRPPRDALAKPCIKSAHRPLLIHVVFLQWAFGVST